jgi:hypothetical protein
MITVVSWAQLAAMIEPYYERRDSFAELSLGEQLCK